LVVARLAGAFGSREPIDQRIRGVSFGVFGAAGGTLGSHNPTWPAGQDPDTQTQNNLTVSEAFYNDYRSGGLFIIQYPKGRQDRWGGRVCTRTGWWGPACRITYVDGKPYIDIFAPSIGAAEKNTMRY
jgi:hypothetical protein